MLNHLKLVFVTIMLPIKLGCIYLRLKQVG